MVYVPGFLVNKVYERGSLENTPGGFQFSFRNRMTPLRISGMRDVKVDVDGTVCPSGSIGLVLGESAICMNGGGFDEVVSFGKDDKLTISVEGSPLERGRHTIRVAFVTREYGGASLKINDSVGEAQTTAWQRLRQLLGWAKSGQQVISISGELGGCPLDPDFTRLEAVLRREEPDRVPLFEAEIEPPIQEAFLGREINSSADTIEFYIRAGYDFAPVLPPFFAPRLMRTADDVDNTLNSADQQRTWIQSTEGIIETVADVEKFPWPKAADVDFTSFDEVAALLPAKMKTVGLLVPGAIFGNASQSMGLERFSYALYDNPKVVEALFEVIGPTYVEIAKRLVKAPRLGAVLMADDLAYTEGTLVSPEVYRKYVFPWYRQIGEVLANANIPFIFHSDGKLWKVLDDLADCGVRAIHPVEPLAMDIVDLKRRYGDRFCIFGNIDLEYTLTRGTTAEVDAAVKNRISQLAPGGGYGVAASNSVPEYVKPENYRAMVEAVMRYGKYPITV